MREIWTTLGAFFPILPARARRFLIGYVIGTSALTVLDVAAMSLLALVITPAISNRGVSLPLLGPLPVDATPWLVLAACLLIILKSALLVLLHFIATRRFSVYEFEIGRRLFEAYIHSSWEERSRRSTAEVTRVADMGIANAVMGFLLPLLRIPANALTFVLIVLVLVVSQPTTAIVAVVYLSVIFFLVNRPITKHSLIAAEVDRDYSFRTATLMTEVVEALKELTLRGRLMDIADAVGRNRRRAVHARANTSFLGILPQYTFEAALIGGFLVVGLSAYVTSDMTGAIGAVALFAAAGFRLMPAMSGIQSSLVYSSSSIPWAKDVVADIARTEADVAVTVAADPLPLPAEPHTLDLRGVTFSYPGSPERVLDGLDLDLRFGSSLGIVGPSGAGKSTLIDILLGLSVPTSGSISIDGTPLRDVLHQWRSRVGYVPQKVALFDGSIAQNVALTWGDDFDRDKVLEVLDKAQLLSLVEARGNGIDERIGERGVSLSGGQQQRLGIARALYSDPLVLVLDEATSSLDTKTEDDVIRSLRALRGEITLIAVAHRISTIRDYDQICYLDGGRILGKDTFDGLAASLPQFGLQVELAGLGAAPLTDDAA